MKKYFKTQESLKRQKFKAKRRRRMISLNRAKQEHNENLAALEAISRKFSLKLS